jgi:hypothetical protein
VEGRLLEGVAQREDQAVRQRIALGAARQADDGDVVANVELEVWMWSWCAFRVAFDYGYEK